MTARRLTQGEETRRDETRNTYYRYMRWDRMYSLNSDWARSKYLSVPFLLYESIGIDWRKLCGGVTPYCASQRASAGG